jgi:hypothetical protein
VTDRRQRSTAKKPPKNLRTFTPLAFSRTTRASAAAASSALADLTSYTESRGTKRKRNDDDENDSDFVLNDEFKPSMRLTVAPATYSVATRAAANLTVVSKAFTKVAGTAGRGDAKATMGKSAADYANNNNFAASAGVKFEWCHVIADSLGGPTTKDNLFCGGYNANTHMMAVEGLLSGKTHLEVQVEAHCQTGTTCAEKIVYRVQKPGSANIFEDTFDSLSTGFNPDDYRRVRTKLKTWLNSTGKRARNDGI